MHSHARTYVPVLYQGAPLCEVPVHLLERAQGQTRLPAQQHHHGVALSGDEAQKEHVAAPAVVAFEHGLSQGGVGVQRDLLALRPHLQHVEEKGREGEGERVSVSPSATTYFSFFFTFFTPLCRTAYVRRMYA